MKLTSDTVRAIAPVPPKTEIIVFDDDLPGFGVRARLADGRSSSFNIRSAIGSAACHWARSTKSTSAKLGKWPRKS
jgi:hypothetical protein